MASWSRCASRPQVDAEDGADGNGDIDVAGAIDGIEADEVGVSIVVRDGDDVLQLLARHRGHEVRLPEVALEGALSFDIKALDRFALNVDFSGASQHAGEAGHAGEAPNFDGRTGDRVEHGVQGGVLGEAVLSDHGAIAS